MRATGARELGAIVCKYLFWQASKEASRVKERKAASVDSAFSFLS